MEKSLNPTTTIKIGGTGSKFVKLVEGTVNTYLSFSNNPTGAGLCRWDTLSGEVLINCISGKASDVFGD